MAHLFSCGPTCAQHAFLPLSGLYSALLGLCGLSWGSLGALLGCLGVAKQPRADPKLGPSEISEIVTIPTRELHFRPFMGLSLGSFGALLGSLGGLLGSFGALLRLSWVVLGFSWAHLCFLEAILGYTWCSRACLLYTSPSPRD